MIAEVIVTTIMGVTGVWSAPYTPPPVEESAPPPVVVVQETVHIHEDEEGWDCETMGNKVCGTTTSVVEEVPAPCAIVYFTQEDEFNFTLDTASGELLTAIIGNYLNYGPDTDQFSEDMILRSLDLTGLTSPLEVCYG